MDILGSLGGGVLGIVGSIYSSYQAKSLAQKQYKRTKSLLATDFAQKQELLKQSSEIQKEEHQFELEKLQLELNKETPTPYQLQSATPGTSFFGTITEGSNLIYFIIIGGIVMLFFISKKKRK